MAGFYSSFSFSSLFEMYFQTNNFFNSLRLRLEDTCCLKSLPSEKFFFAVKCSENSKFSFSMHNVLTCFHVIKLLRVEV